MKLCRSFRSDGSFVPDPDLGPDHSIQRREPHLRQDRSHGSALVGLGKSAVCGL